MRKSQLPLALPLFLIVCLYLFLITANYFYATRAAHMLDRIRAMKLDNSSIAAIKRLGSERGIRLDAAGDCDQVADCGYMVSTNNQWMRSMLGPAPIAAIGKHIGLKSWGAAGDVLTRDGQVYAKIFGLDLQFSGRSIYPEVEAVTWVQLDPVKPCRYYPVKRHSGYAFFRASNIRSLEIIVSDSASPENRNRAFQFNLGCTTWQNCNDFSEVVPAAWADYESDQQWLHEHWSEQEVGCTK